MKLKTGKNIVSILCIMVLFVSISLSACGESTDDTKEPSVETTTEKETETETEEEVVENYTTPTDFATKKSDVDYGKLEEVEYNSTTTGNVRKCYVLTPAGYSEEKEYPILYLLHGIGGTHTEWLGGSPQNIIGNLIASGEAKEMIVVMPNVRAMANDGTPSNILSQENIDAFDNFINDLKVDLMPFIEENYSVSTKWEDTAIAGLSMGGREALFIGFSMLDTFSYIGAFSPAPGLLPDTSLDYAGQFQEDEFTITEGDTIPKLILICNGQSDATIGTVPSYYHNTLTNNNVDHIWYTTTGGHDFTVWKNGLYNFVSRIFKD